MVRSALTAAICATFVAVAGASAQRLSVGGRVGLVGGEAWRCVESSVDRAASSCRRLRHRSTWSFGTESGAERTSSPPSRRSWCRAAQGGEWS